MSHGFQGKNKMPGKVSEALKSAGAAFAALAFFWHFFGSALGKRVANSGRGRARHRPRQTENDPARNVPIDPV